MGVSKRLYMGVSTHTYDDVLTHLHTCVLQRRPLIVAERQHIAHGKPEGGILSTLGIISEQWGVRGAFLTIFEVKVGTPQSEMNGLVVLDTEKGA